MVGGEAGKTNTDISSAEWTDLSLSGLNSHTPLFGYFFNDADTYGPLNFITEEFIEGPTAFEIKQKEGRATFDEKNRDDPSFDRPLLGRIHMIFTPRTLFFGAMAMKKQL